MSFCVPVYSQCDFVQQSIVLFVIEFVCVCVEWVGEWGSSSLQVVDFLLSSVQLFRVLVCSSLQWSYLCPSWVLPLRPKPGPSNHWQPQPLLHANKGCQELSHLQHQGRQHYKVYAFLLEEYVVQQGPFVPLQWCSSRPSGFWSP